MLLYSTLWAVRHMSRLSSLGDTLLACARPEELLILLLISVLLGAALPTGFALGLCRALRVNFVFLISALLGAALPAGFALALLLFGPDYFAAYDCCNWPASKLPIGERRITSFRRES
ncbi:hypothetical protein D3C81_1099970 [compost metagenome]